MVIDTLSRERLIPYLIAVGHHEAAALDLYAWSLRLSESFYPLLSVTEVALRNAIAGRIRAVHGERWWENPDFHEAIGKTAKGTASRARKDRFEEKGYVTHGCMVAELTFGFWTKMLLPKHEGNYWTPIQTFSPNLPPDVTFDRVEARCKAVTDLRNRIFHHEPLLRRDISREYRDTLELVSWIDPRLAEWVRPQLRIMSVLRERPRHRTQSWIAFPDPQLKCLAEVAPLTDRNDMSLIQRLKTYGLDRFVPFLFATVLVGAKRA